MLVVKRKKYLQKVVLVLLLLSAGREAYAELTEDLFDISLPNVISASRLNQSVLQAPSAVTVIDKHMIELSGFIEFVDVLRLVPGFQVAHFDSRLFTATYHGFGWEWSNNLQILVDGRSTYSAGLSSIDWDTIGVQLADVERIEVVRGPSASAYGSNSFVAAINVVTKRQQLEPKIHIEAMVSNRGDKRLIMKTSAKRGNNAYTLTYTGREDDGDHLRIDHEDYEYDANRNLHSLSLRNEFTKGKQKLNTAISFTRGSTAPFPNSELLIDERKVTDKTIHLRWAKEFDVKELNINFFHHAHNDDDIRSTKNLNLLPLPQPYKDYIASLDNPYISIGYQEYNMHRSDLEVQLSGGISALQYVIGAGIRDDNIKSETYLKAPGTKSEQSYRIFFNSQYNISQNLLLNSGLIYEGSNRNDNNFSPRFSINWTPVVRHSIRFGYSQAYRTPSILENNLESKAVIGGFVLDDISESSRNLNSPKIESADIGYIGSLENLPISWEFKLYKDRQSLYTDFVPYFGINDINNKKSFVINNGLYKAYGLEGSVTYRPDLKNILRFHFNRGHSKDISFSRLKPLVTRVAYDYMPRESYGLLLGRDFGDYVVSSGIYHVGFREWAGGGEPVEAYTRYDVSFAKKIKLSNSDLELKVIAQRLGGEYQEMNDEFEFEKEFYVQLKWIFD